MMLLLLQKNDSKKLSFSNGFTLVEVIVSLVLLSILVSVAGLGLVRVVEGYAFSRENAEMTQKAQLAMGRMTREIVELLRIEHVTASSVVLENREGLRSFGLHENSIRLALGSNDFQNGDLLLEGVDGLKFSMHSGSKKWEDGDPVETLSMVDIELRLNRSDGTVMTFMGRAAPRNNKNIGGASPTTPPPTAPSYGLCMISVLAENTASVERLWQMAWAVITGLILCMVLFIKGFYSQKHGGFSQERGSILIGLVVTLVVISVLTAAVVPMFTVSTMNQVVADQGRKAFFLAESGFRYAASEFLNAGEEKARLAVLDDMHGQTYTLADNRGAFSLSFEPYWFKTTGTQVNSNTISVKVHGNVPVELTAENLSQGRIVVGSTMHTYTGGSGGASILTFTGLIPPLTASAGTDVRLSSRVSSAQNMARNGNLSLSTGDSWGFPELNGNFTLKGSGVAGITETTVFNYEQRVGNTLRRVTMSDPLEDARWNSSLSIDSAANVVLEPYLRVRSTGIAGGAQREVTYSVPVGWIAGGGDEFKQEIFHDRFDSLGAWFAGRDQMLGSHGLSDGALKVNAVVDPTTTGIGLVDWIAGLFGWGNDGRWAAVVFNWSNLNTNLAQSWMDHRGALRYDLQAKVKNNEPYFMAGLGFRMRNNFDGSDLHTYGVSFLRQRETRSRGRILGVYTSWSEWGFDDDIHPGLRPFALGSHVSSGETIQSAGWLLGEQIQARYSLPALLFWQRTGPSTGTGSFQRIAHRDISGDGVTVGTGTALRLKEWSSIMVRVQEGWELTFDQGRANLAGRHLKVGDRIQNYDGSKTARVMSMPVLGGGGWGGGSAAHGSLLLAQMEGGDFTANEKIYLKGDTSHAQIRTLSQGASKVNWVMAYVSDNKNTPELGDGSQSNVFRRGNPRNQANWPPDDWTDRAAGNDYFTLVKWAGVPGGGATFVPSAVGSELKKAVIRTSALLSPVWTEKSTATDFVTGNGDHVSLITSSSAGTSTYYDDFAIQLDQKAGTGFLPPVQQ
ncbi:prepilin-type N-terminal cleavage/methylation domain-containing protein [Desulfobotulus sp. H1]|uniref:Prepilin-type N-terminal cleavage/methylation domain-containing protein n=1 Tax=Desulfobotulus pelophilus TaxID=2823377 RepID=A0ABT3NAK3_9BACT|nr:prepilin-type N-terminal cleavage/methylation domain-containing protein [Desulfobotulus pelophilus]MCW7754474.1 prepilin-type N-terminal cleavage/methylation domain-containing protein [Desulfobotulus pelophilus]